jgi:hypothetical protein
MVFFVKAFISWVAQVAGLHVALLVPGLMLFSIVFFSSILNPEKPKS